MIGLSAGVTVTVSGVAVTPAPPGQDEMTEVDMVSNSGRVSILCWVLLLCFSAACAQGGGLSAAQQTLANPGALGVDAKVMVKLKDWQELMKYFKDTPVPSNELGITGSGEKPWLTLCLHNGLVILAARCKDFDTLWTQKSWNAASAGALDWALDYWSNHSKATLGAHSHRGERHLIGAALGWLRDLGVVSKSSLQPRDVSQTCLDCINFVGDCLYCLGGDCTHCH